MPRREATACPNQHQPCYSDPLEGFRLVRKDHSGTLLHSVFINFIAHLQQGRRNRPEEVLPHRGLYSVVPFLHACAKVPNHLLHIASHIATAPSSLLARKVWLHAWPNQARHH